jgi:hypothetical protein
MKLTLSTGVESVRTDSLASSARYAVVRLLEGVMHPSGSRIRNFHASIISLVLLEGVMHPSGYWMLDFHASIISLVLLEGVMHPSGYWMLDFHASVVSLVLFLGKGLEIRDVHFGTGPKVRVGFLDSCPLCF